jgi:hypothetical protein
MCDDNAKRLERRTKPQRSKLNKLLTEGRLIDEISGPTIVSTERQGGKIVVKFQPVCPPGCQPVGAAADANLTLPPTKD